MTDSSSSVPMPPPPYVLWKGEARCPECMALLGEPHGLGLPTGPNAPAVAHPCQVGLYIEQFEALKDERRRWWLRARS